MENGQNCEKCQNHYRTPSYRRRRRRYQRRPRHDLTGPVDPHYSYAMKLFHNFENIMSCFNNINPRYVFETVPNLSETLTMWASYFINVKLSMRARGLANQQQPQQPQYQEYVAPQQQQQPPQQYQKYVAPRHQQLYRSHNDQERQEPEQHIFYDENARQSFHDNDDDDVDDNLQTPLRSVVGHVSNALSQTAATGVINTDDTMSTKWEYRNFDNEQDNDSSASSEVASDSDIVSAVTPISEMKMDEKETKEKKDDWNNEINE